MKNKRGFTLVELLCIIVILGVCITASIVAVTRVINTAKKDETATQEQLLMKTCETYIQDHKEKAPKVVGNTTNISLKELFNNKYIKEKIVDYNNESVYKLSNNKYTYTPYLYCGNQKVDEIEYIYEPTINMYFVGSDDKNKVFENLDDAYVYMDITGGTTKGGNPIAINSYSFNISVKDAYGKEIEKYESSVIEVNDKNNLNVKEKLIDYVKVENSAYISINVLVKNVIGGYKEVTTTTQYINK